MFTMEKLYVAVLVEEIAEFGVGDGDQNVFPFF